MKARFKSVKFCSFLKCIPSHTLVKDSMIWISHRGTRKYSIWDSIDVLQRIWTWLKQILTISKIPLKFRHRLIWGSDLKAVLYVCILHMGAGTEISDIIYGCPFMVPMARLSSTMLCGEIWNRLQLGSIIRSLYTTLDTR